MADAVLSVMMPVMIGMRPFASFTTISVMRRVSAVVSVWPSPVLPQTAKPWTLANSTMYRVSARMASSSMVSSSRNGVVMGGTMPKICSYMETPFVALELTRA